MLNLIAIQTSRFLLGLLLFIVLSAPKDSKQYNSSGTVRFSTQKIYLVCRGTLSKAGVVAGQFNAADTNSTHVGIGYFTGNTLLVYHVSDVKRKGHSLLVDSLASYTDVEDLKYLGIWECNNTPAELEKMKQVCASYLARNIGFDPYFNIRDDDTLYCSEFCAAVLQQVDPYKFSFHPRTVPVPDGFYQAYLRRDKLTYYPVDFFQQHSGFIKVMEKRFKNTQN
jgi:hypothetical protein